MAVVSSVCLFEEVGVVCGVWCLVSGVRHDVTKEVWGIRLMYTTYGLQAMICRKV